MKRKNATAAVTLIAALVTVVALYFSYGTTETATPLPSAEQQKQVSDLKKQITVLE